MWFDVMCEKISQFWNHPVAQTGFTIGMIIVGIITIISKTSIGRKALNWMKNSYVDLLNKFNDFKAEKEKQIEQLKLEYINEFLEEKRKFDEQIAILDNENQDLRNLIIYIGENINNKNIQSYIADFKAKMQDHATELNDVVNAEVQKVKDMYENTLQSLVEKINDLESKVEQYGRDKETKE